MAGDPQKTPPVQTLNSFAAQKIQDAIQQLGQALPCHVTAINGQIVTVAFDVQSADPAFQATLPTVSLPIATSLYDWIPIQKGDKGYTVPADVNLGGVSGLGGGTATFTQPGNLTALVHTPVSNASWSVPNVNQRVVQGPEGVLLRDIPGNSTIDITAGTIVATRGASSMTLTGSTAVLQQGTASITIENGTIAFVGSLFFNGNSYLLHEHVGVTTGVDNTGTVA